MKVLLLSLLIFSVLYTTQCKEAAKPKAKPAVKAAPKDSTHHDAGCPKNMPGPDVLSLTDEKAQQELMLKVFPSWKGKTLSKKDLSGAGGSKLFMYTPQGDNIVPFAAVLKIDQPSASHEAKEESFDKKVTNAVACALYKNNKSTVINAAEGKNWKIQESAGFEGKIWNMQYPPKLVGELMARLHNTPIDWATPLFEEVYKMNPFARSWPHNAMPFWQAKSKQKPEYLTLFTELNSLEMSLHFKVPEVSKRTTTIHGDFHDYNFLYADHKKDKLRVIDLDTAWVGNPLVDLSRNMWTMNLDFHHRIELVQEYLHHMGIKNPGKEKVYDMLYDAEVYKLFTAIEGYLWKLAPMCAQESAHDPGFIPKQMQDLVQIWNKAGENKKSQMEIIEHGIFLYAHKNDKNWSKWATTSRCGKSMYFIQPDFRKEENFTDLMEQRGPHGAPVHMKEVNTYLSHFPDLFKHDDATHHASEPWDAYYKKGGFKFALKPEASLIIFFGPIEGKQGRRFVFGTTRKSGYPYAMMTGWMKFKANKKDGKAQVWFRTTKWHAMSLGFHDPHAELHGLVENLEKGIAAGWEHQLEEDEHHKDHPAKKALAKKAPAKKAPAKKTPAKKTPAKKAPAKKAPVNKAPAQKVPHIKNLRHMPEEKAIPSHKDHPKAPHKKEAHHKKEVHHKKEDHHKKVSHPKATSELEKLAKAALKKAPKHKRRLLKK